MFAAKIQSVHTTIDGLDRKLLFWWIYIYNVIADNVEQQQKNSLYGSTCKILLLNPDKYNFISQI